jgi:Glycosyltransferase family 87
MLTPLRNPRNLALFIAVLGIVVWQSFVKGDNMAQTGGDFAVFWWAGKNFLAGNDLYSNIGGAERFIYPPFAAMWFQFFGINTLRGAGICWAFANFGLYALSIALLHRIYLHFYEDSRALRWAIFGAAVLSIRYFLYHQIYIQVNEVMFTLCLAGILSHLEGKNTAAAAFFTVGAFIKVLPIFFLVWLVSKGTVRESVVTGLKILGVAAICMLLPMLFRGFEQGWIDHLRYYKTFLEPFQNGRVEPEFRNYSLSSLVYNWCQPTQNEPMGFSYRLFDCTLAQTKLIYKIGVLTLLGTWGLMMLHARFITKKTNFWEIAYIFLIMNLVSGICWEYHLVSIIFVLIPFVHIFTQKETKYTISQRFLPFLLLLSAFLLNIVGIDTVGTKGMHYIGGYGLLTLIWLVFAGYSAWGYARFSRYNS